MKKKSRRGVEDLICLVVQKKDRTVVVGTEEIKTIKIKQLGLKTYTGYMK